MLVIIFSNIVFTGRGAGGKTSVVRGRNETNGVKEKGLEEQKVSNDVSLNEDSPVVPKKQDTFCCVQYFLIQRRSGTVSATVT